jgi:hypothetical protein
MAKIGGNYVDESILTGTPDFAAAVPSDSTVLSNVRSVYCITAGTLQAVNRLGVTVPIAMTAGQTVPISPSKIMAATTGTYVMLQ